jgi:hypothetical protein
MTTTIGRCSLASAPYDQSHSGDRLSFSIDIVGLALAEAKVRRQQLLGLVNNADEEVVPFTSSDDSDLDGFYRVSSVQVDPTIVYLRDGTMRCQISMERVGGGYAKPTFEIGIVAAPRYRVGVGTLNPSGAVNWLVSGMTYGVGESGGYGFAGTVAPMYDATRDLVTATGTIVKIDAFSTLATSGSSGLLACYAAPADAYAGAALIEQSVGGTWYPVVGRQIPRSLGRGWRISNGLVRLSLSQSTLGSLLIEVWGGSAWESSPLLNRRDTGDANAGYYGLIDPNSGSDTTAVDPVIIRNSVDTVTVRIPQAASMYETYSISRGQPFASLDSGPMVPGLSGSNYCTGVMLTSGAAVTSITTTTLEGAGGTVWGFYTATDGNGNKLLVGCPSSGLTLTAASGRLYGASSSVVVTHLFGATKDPTGATDAEFETTAVAASMFTAVATQQQVVAR